MHKRLLLLGIALYLAATVYLMPAATVAGWLMPAGVTAYGVSGRIWNGQADALDSQGIQLRNVRWSARPLQLFTGRTAASINAELPGGSLMSTVSRSLFSGDIRFKDLKCVTDLGRLPAGLLQNPVTGRAGLVFEQILLRDGWPVRANGTVDLINLALVSPPADLGIFEVVFDGSTPPVGVITGVDGPLLLDATLELTEGRAYALSGTASAAPGASSDIRQALQFLGPSARDGSVQINFRGTLATPPES